MPYFDNRKVFPASRSEVLDKTASSLSMFPRCIPYTVPVVSDPNAVAGSYYVSRPCLRSPRFLGSSDLPNVTLTSHLMIFTIHHAPFDKIKSRPEMSDFRLYIELQRAKRSVRALRPCRPPQNRYALCYKKHVLSN